MWSVQAIDLEFSRHLPKTNDRTTPQLKACAQRCTKLRALQDGLTASMPRCWEGGFALLLAWAKLDLGGGGGRKASVPAGVEGFAASGKVETQWSK